MKTLLLMTLVRIPLSEVLAEIPLPEALAKVPLTEALVEVSDPGPSVNPKPLIKPNRWWSVGRFLAYCQLDLLIRLLVVATLLVDKNGIENEVRCINKRVAVRCLLDCVTIKITTSVTFCQLNKIC